MIRVLIVDDSSVIRSFLHDVLSSEPEIEVVGTAENCEMAEQKILSLAPDVVTLDVELPDGNGLKLLAKLKHRNTTRFIMVSAATQSGTDTTIKALQEGALDFVAKPLASSDEAWTDFGNELISKCKLAISSRNQNKLTPKKTIDSAFGRGGGKLIVIGGSTGAVPVVEQILVGMNRSCPPLVVGLHMPRQFTAQLARRLNEAADIFIAEAQDGMPLSNGTALIAPGELHLSIRSSGSGYVCKLEDGPKISGHKPSLDVLFSSVAKAAKSEAVGLILTGMGRDGVAGLQSMRDVGAITACQDQASSMVYGMPKVAMETGAAQHEVNLNDVLDFLVRASGGAKPDVISNPHARTDRN